MALIDFLTDEVAADLDSLIALLQLQRGRYGNLPVAVAAMGADQKVHLISKVEATFCLNATVYPDIQSAARRRKASNLPRILLTGAE